MLLAWTVAGRIAAKVSGENFSFCMCLYITCVLPVAPHLNSDNLEHSHWRRDVLCIQ